MNPEQEAKPSIFKRLLQLCRGILLLIGFLFVFYAVLCFFGVPEKIEKKLCPNDKPEKADYIVCLSAGGANPEGYERFFAASWFYRLGYAPKIIVTGALPDDRKIMEALGVKSEDLIFETASQNTADHPIFVSRLEGIDREKDKFLIVSTHYHLWRAKLLFDHAGFKKTLFCPPRLSMEEPIFEPRPPSHLYRYEFWSNAVSGIRLLREAIAVLVWKLGR